MKLRDCWLEITGRCNARCLTCNMWKRAFSHELSLQEIKLLFGSKGLRNIEHVYITGGEPFLREDLPEIVNFIYLKTHCSIALTTNGLLPEVISAMVARMHPAVAIDISLNGTKEKHDVTRGIQGSFHKAIETYERLCGMGIKPAFLCTILPYNIADVAWIQEFSSSLGTSVNFTLARPVERIASENLDIYSYSAEQKDRILSQLPPSLFKDVLESFFSQTLWFPCKYGSRSITISSEGDVYACSHFVPEMKMGSVREGSIDEILHSGRRKEVVNKIRSFGCQPCSISLSHAVNSMRWSARYKIDQRIHTIIGFSRRIGAVIAKRQSA